MFSCYSFVFCDHKDGDYVASGCFMLPQPQLRQLDIIGDLVCAAVCVFELALMGQQLRHLSAISVRLCTKPSTNIFNALFSSLAHCYSAAITSIRGLAYTYLLWSFCVPTRLRSSNPDGAPPFCVGLVPTCPKLYLSQSSHLSSSPEQRAFSWPTMWPSASPSRALAR